MPEDDLIRVGQNSQARYVAFGDDCQFNDICGYAYVVVKRSRIPWILRELNQIKDQFKIPHETPLHCRVLFHYHQRKGAGLAHLTNEDAESIVIKSLLLLNNVGARVRFVSGSVAAYVAATGNSLPMRNQAGEIDLVLPVHHNENHSPKALLAMLAKIGMLTPGPDRRFSSPHEWEVVIGRDATKIKSIGPRKSQVHNMMSGGFSDIGLPPGQFYQFNPHVSTGADHPLLELADVAVYSLSHALDTDNSTLFWRTQLPSIRLLNHIPFAPVQMELS